MAAPDEPDVAVTGGDTPSGALRRLLSRDGSSLFGSRTNGSLAPPLSVPVDPLLAGPPMESTYVERGVSGNGSSYHDDDGRNGRYENGHGVAVDDEDDLGDDLVDGEERADWPDSDESIDVVEASEIEVLDADDEVIDAELLPPQARFTPSPLLDPPATESVDLVDPPATVMVPALIPSVEAPDAPLVDEPVARSTVPPPPRRRRTRPRVRKVTRIVRYVDAWSVFKVALLLNAVLAAVMVTAAVLLWNLAYSTDVIDNTEGVIEDWLAYETFAFDGRAMFRAMVVLAVLFVIAATGLAVLAATLFNLISDLTGGIKVTVLEREVLAAVPQRAPKRRGAAARRAAAGFPSPRTGG